MQRGEFCRDREELLRGVRILREREVRRSGAVVSNIKPHRQAEPGPGRTVLRTGRASTSRVERCFCPDHKVIALAQRPGRSYAHPLSLEPIMHFRGGGSIA